MQRRFHPTATMPRDRAFWAAVSVLLVGQLIAFWMVCTQQVRMAQERHASAQVEALAVAHCMRSVDATLAGCTQRVAPPDGQKVATAGPSAPVENTAAEPPVNSVYH